MTIDASKYFVKSEWYRYAGDNMLRCSVQLGVGDRAYLVASLLDDTSYSASDEAAKQLLITALERLLYAAKNGIDVDGN